jgi:hypothetical protein
MQTRSSTRQLIVAMLGIWVALSSAALAATCVWTNPAAGGSFTNAASWSNGVPGSADNATLPYDPYPWTPTVTIDGGDRAVGLLQTLGAGKFIVNLNAGAVLSTRLDIGRSGWVVISNGTFNSTGNHDIGGQFSSPGRVYVNGGSFTVTNASILNMAAGLGVNGLTLLEVNPGGSFRYAPPDGSMMTVGYDSANAGGKAILRVNGGTATVAGASSQLAITYPAAANERLTSQVEVVSGAFSAFTGSVNQAIRVGHRHWGAAVWDKPNSIVISNLAVFVVSNGTVNVGGYGLWVGRSTNASPGEFNMYGGTVNLGGLTVGDLGRMTQTGGVLTFTAKTAFSNEATDGQRHFYISGGTSRFDNVEANAMTINLGTTAGGNVLGQGLYNVVLGSTGRPPFTVTLPNPLYGCGTAGGGNGKFRDGVMDLTVWTNVTVAWNGTNYSGLAGPTSLKAFVGTATTWGWDAEVAPLEPHGSMVLLK